MAATEGTIDVRLGAPGPWAPRRIPFISTSTYASSPAMEPLNQPVARTDRTNVSNGSGNGHHQYQSQQQFHRQGPKNIANGNNRLGRSEPQNLPSNMPLQWTAPQKIGAGLSNLGNTCFLNSVLQCLTYTPPLAGYLQSGQHKVSCRVAGFCAFCALQEHVQQALASSGKVVSPQKLAKNLRSICRSFKMGRQEDSHEYMRYLLDALHKCCLPPDLAANSNSKSSQEKSLVYRIFGGQLRSQVKCTVCSYCSNTYDPFLDLSLEISRADSLVKALSRFTAVDVLDGDNKYRCLRCKKKVRALKSFTIDSVPNILTVQFKRFAGGQGGKIDKRVDFPTMLDLGPFVSNEQGSRLMYKLFGVLVHSGWSTHSGHYYSFLRASSDIWHVFDDTRVRQVSEQTVLEQKAYMLFYVRDCKRTRVSHPELPTPAASQASPRQSIDTNRDRHNNNTESAVPLRHALPTCAADEAVISQGIEREAVSEENFPRKVSSPFSTSDEDPSKALESDGHRAAAAAQGPAQAPQTAGHIRDEDDGHGLAASDHASEPLSANGVNPDIGGGGDRLDGIPLDLPVPGCLDESAVGLCPPTAGDADLSNRCGTGPESKSTCSTTANHMTEDDWDEYYKKGCNNNTSATPPPKYMKMLKAIPHTRRYYQARTLPVRRSSKVASSGSEAELAQSAGSSKATFAATGKDMKRPLAGDENNVRENKRQHRDSAPGRISSTCMAMEELSRYDSVEETPSEEHGQRGQENGSKGVSKNVPDEVELATDSHEGDGVGQRSKFVDTHPDMTLEEKRRESNGHGGAPHHRQGDASVLKDVQCPGSEQRGSSSSSAGNDCQYGDAPDSRASAGRSFLEPAIEPSCDASSKTDTSKDGRNLYGDSVSRWADVDASMTKDVDQLVNAEPSRNAKQDAWDVEYDKGRSKKVRSKVLREPLESTLSGSVTEEITPKPTNPFQAFGLVKQRGGMTFRNGNSIGFKAGYGYGLKSGKDGISSGGQAQKST